MIDTDKYTEALRGIARGGLISVDAASVCVNLAVNELDCVYRETLFLADDRIAALTEDLEKLQLDTEAECAALYHQIRERDEIITAGRAENRQLFARIAELEAQLDAANSRPMTLVANGAVPPSLAELSLEELADGDGYHARLVELQARLDALRPPNSDFVREALMTAGAIQADADAILQPPVDGGASGAYTRVIDWNGLPEEYRDDPYRLMDGAVKWSELPIPARRSIALYAIGQLADDGSLTMAQYHDNKPLFMPTGGAISQMFGIRWTQVVENAVTHAAKAVQP